MTQGEYRVIIALGDQFLEMICFFVLLVGCSHCSSHGVWVGWNCRLGGLAMAVVDLAHEG